MARSRCSCLVLLEDGEGGAETVHRLGPEGPVLPEPRRDLN